MNSNSLIQHSLAGQHFGYSAADLGDLGAPEYTLVTIGIDESTSVQCYKQAIEKCIQEIIKSCKFSPRSDYLLVRLVAFNGSMREIHGFKQLVDCDINDYTNSIHPGGCTALFSTAQNIISATNDYGKTLADQDYDVNAIVFIITDGEDNSSGKITSISVGEALKSAMHNEYLESILTVLIGVGVGDFPSISGYLNSFQTEAGLNKYIEIKDANDKTLAKLADFISKSISSQSNSLNSGSASNILTF